MKVVDNYLPQDYFEHLKPTILGHNFPWLYEAEVANVGENQDEHFYFCLLYTSPSPRDRTRSRMPSSA